VEAKVTVHCHDISKEELLQLLQGIRDAEQAHFREKKIGIWMETVPEMPSEEAADLFSTLVPPFEIFQEGFVWKGPKKMSGFWWPSSIVER